MFLFDGFLTKAASWREKARIYRIFLELIFTFIVYPSLIRKFLFNYEKLDSIEFLYFRSLKIFVACGGK